MPRIDTLTPDTIAAGLDYDGGVVQFTEPSTGEIGSRIILGGRCRGHPQKPETPELVRTCMYPYSYDWVALGK